MPTYEYLCQSCSHRFETWQKMTDEPLTTCPECGQHIRRVLYATGVIFKGSGFYKTDHSNNGTLPTANGDSSKAASTTESAKSDAKTTESTSSEASTTKATASENKTARAAAS